MGRGFQNGQYAERKVEIVFGRGGGLGLRKINQQKCLSLFKNILPTISDKINFLNSLKSLNSFDVSLRLHRSMETNSFNRLLLEKAEGQLV